MKPKVYGEERVWGPSVGHSYDCAKRELNELPCSCNKRFYCEGCDDMHWDNKCPRTILDAMVEKLTFNEKSLKTLINEILDSAEKRSSLWYSMSDHVKSRIDELADCYGNLGMSRRKLHRLAQKELKRRWRRGRKARLKNARNSC